MKKLFIDDKGFLAVNVYIIGLIIFTVLLSSLTILAKDFEAVQSNSHSIKAYFLAEAAMEEVYHQLMELTEEAIEQYFQDLMDYKLEFISKITAGEVEKNQFDAPLLKQYINGALTVKLNTLNRQVEAPFEDYPHNHSYKSVVTIKPDQNTIEIYATGVYNQAKRYIRGEVQLPIQYYEGKDEKDLPYSKVSALKMNGFYQTY